jgi:Fe2+ transport system protein B
VPFLRTSSARLLRTLGFFSVFLILNAAAITSFHIYFAHTKTVISHSNLPFITERPTIHLPYAKKVKLSPWQSLETYRVLRC